MILAIVGLALSGRQALMQDEFELTVPSIMAPSLLETVV
jgi:hypothetical protein